MPGLKSMLAALLMLVLLGCADKETVYRSLYDGLQKREEVVHPGSGPTADAAPGYDAYRRERSETLKPPE